MNDYKIQQEEGMIKKIKKNFNKGFSLMEMLIWVSIAGVFGSIIGFSSVSAINNAKYKAADQELSIFQAALLQYYQDYGEYPSDDEGLQKLIEEGFIQKGSNSEGALKDPWKSEYKYTVASGGQKYKVICFGSDKKEGGEGKTSKDIEKEEGIDEDTL